MEYTPDLEKRVQKGKDDTDPQHDVIKRRINKANPKDRRCLYFVPVDGENYGFCSNDPFVQAMISDKDQYKRQIVSKGAIFHVLDRVKSDLGVTSNQAQSTTQTSKTEPQVPFCQSRLAKAIKGLRNLDLKALNELCLRHKYTPDWTNFTMQEKPHSNPSFKGGLYLYDNLSGKRYAFASDWCGSKKGVQYDICSKLFSAALSNSNTIGEPTKEQQADMDRRQEAEKQRIQKEIEEQNNVRKNQDIFEIKKQKLIEDWRQGKVDVETFKGLREVLDKVYKVGQSSDDWVNSLRKIDSSTQFYTVLDDIIEKHPEVAEPLTKTFVATYGFSLKGGREERSGWNSESENFFLKHQNCIKYVQKEFDAFVEPYKKQIAQQKALDELAPTVCFTLDVNDGRDTYVGYYHTTNEEHIKQKGKAFGFLMCMGDDWHLVSSSFGEKTWDELDVIRDENGEKIDESRNVDINWKIAQVYGVDLYKEVISTAEQKQYAKEIVDNYKTIKAEQEQKRAAQKRIQAIKAKQQAEMFQSLVAENGTSSKMSREDIVGAISQMEVVPSKDNESQTGYNREYTFKSKSGKEYKLNIIDNQDKTLSVKFGSFSFSAKLTSVKEDYNPNDGVLNKVFEHELKQAVHAKEPSNDAIIIDAALRKVGVLGYPSAIKKKIEEGQVNPVTFSR